jgi:CRISPR-associated protein Csm2
MGRFREGRASWVDQLKEIGATKQAVAAAVQRGGKELVKLAEQLGPLVQKNKLSTSQIRNAYGMVKRMEMNGFDAHEFIMLKPRLAYAAARAPKEERDGPQQLKEVLSWAIDEVGDSAENFVRFVDFFEAILAYHKAAGGR